MSLGNKPVMPVMALSIDLDINNAWNLIQCVDWPRGQNHADLPIQYRVTSYTWPCNSGTL